MRRRDAAISILSLVAGIAPTVFVLLVGYDVGSDPLTLLLIIALAVPFMLLSFAGMLASIFGLSL
jgi:hypothetical protein